MKIYFILLLTFICHFEKLHAQNYVKVLNEIEESISNKKYEKALKLCDYILEVDDRIDGIYPYKFAANLAISKIYSDTNYSRIDFNKSYIFLQKSKLYLDKYSLENAHLDLTTQKSFIDSLLLNMRFDYPGCENGTYDDKERIVSVLNSTGAIQNDNQVELLVTGQGKTINEAHIFALRSSIEQAFGSYISSKTDIVNNEIINDEIVSISNGSVQNYDVISDIKLSDNTFLSTIRAKVSVSKLTSYCKSKGYEVEFKGKLFAQNIQLQELDDKNEIISFNNIFNLLNNEINNCINAKVVVSDPILIKDSLWKVPLGIISKLNDNIKIYKQVLITYLSSVSLSKEKCIEYNKLGKKIYELNLNINDSIKTFYLRNKIVADNIYYLPKMIIFKSLSKINVINNLTNKNIYLDKINIVNFKTYVNPVYLDQDAAPKNPFRFSSIFNDNNITNGLDYIITKKPKYVRNGSFYDSTKMLIEFNESRNVTGSNTNRGIVTFSSDLKFNDLKDVSNLFDIAYEGDSLVQTYRTLLFDNFFGSDKILYVLNFNDIVTLNDINNIEEYKIIN
ncbi:MAG: hypothetical protein KA534_06185 [Sediminibacterium sp.]|nr:hypothetical protein [Sediminibacterium sp.]